MPMDDDQADDVRQRQPEPAICAEHHHRRVGEDRGDHEAQHGDDAQAAVVEQRVEDHQRQADDAGDQAAAELVGAEGRGDLLDRAAARTSAAARRT